MKCPSCARTLAYSPWKDEFLACACASADGKKRLSTVDCPRCFVKAGEWCLSTRGKPVPDHEERKKLEARMREKAEA